MFQKEWVNVVMLALYRTLDDCFAHYYFKQGLNVAVQFLHTKQKSILLETHHICPYHVPTPRGENVKYFARLAYACRRVSSFRYTNNYFCMLPFVWSWLGLYL
jgi:hypothetical protein